MRHYKAIERNAELLGASGARIVQTDAYEWLASTDVAAFDLIFLDPPFADDSLAKLCRLIEEHGRLVQGGRVYLEQDRSRPAPELPEHWSLTKDKTAGNVRYMLAEAGDPKEN